MQTVKKFGSVTVVLMMLLLMTACNKYSPATEYTNVTLGGLKLDIRSDMEFDNTQKNADGEKTEGYYCDYFGLVVTSETFAQYKLEGYNDVASYLECVIEANNLDSEVKMSGDKCYMDYKNTVDGVEYTYSAYGLELGYSYYMVQFFARSGEEETYRAEYEKILETVELAEIPPETQEIVMDGVKMTVSGEFTKYDGDEYYGSKYAFLVMSEEFGYLNGVTAKQFASAMLEEGNFTTEDGSEVTEAAALEDEIYSFEYYDEGNYAYNYVRVIDSQVAYFLFVTYNPADDALKAEFEDIVKNATLE